MLLGLVVLLACLLPGRLISHSQIGLFDVGDNLIPHLVDLRSQLRPPREVQILRARFLIALLDLASLRGPVNFKNLKGILIGLKRLERLAKAKKKKLNITSENVNLTFHQQ